MRLRNGNETNGRLKVYETPNRTRFFDAFEHRLAAIKQHPGKPEQDKFSKETFENMMIPGTTDGAAYCDVNAESNVYRLRINCCTPSAP